MELIGKYGTEPKFLRVGGLLLRVFMQIFKELSEEDKLTVYTIKESLLPEEHSLTIRYILSEAMRLLLCRHKHNCILQELLLTALEWRRST